jgi:hypothetical protein
VEFDAVILRVTGDDVDDREQSQRFVIPVERWTDIHRLVSHAIRSFEMGKAFAAARNLDALASDLVSDDPGEGVRSALDGFTGDDASGDDAWVNEGWVDEGWMDEGWVDGLDEDDEDAPGEDDTGLGPDEIELAWDHFTTRLAEVLGVLEPRFFLVLSGPARRFVQVVVSPDGARIETVSNQFLDPADHMTFADLDLLAEVGWQPPTRFRDDERRHRGCPNHHITLPPGWDPHGTARLLVETLRHVHAVHLPDDLSYMARAPGPAGTVLLPTLGIRRDVA